MKTVFYSLVFSIFLILASCGGEGTEAPSCDENTQQDCTIAGGGKGTQICLNGSWSECKPVCVDGDEIPCTTPCKTKGTKLCIAGDWGECIPPPEECNNKDDDCNNLTDDGLGKVECGLGECKHQTDKCSAGVEQSCNPFEGAGPEKCDGLDNNCDGQTDENLIQICSTACGQGTETCDEGVWINCTAKKPELEKCDGLDNDCNNKTDDGINCACTENDTQSCGTDEGECYPGVKKCENNKWGQCGGPNYVGSTAEKCNNKDDDCDGKTDGFTQTCVTACENGKETCVAGQWVNCTAKKPESEKCDGL
ncbi:MAG: hypothetical protein FJ088_09880, partial [Deltaproteobacteria bacterium]|nr:hypothetical protein [Deltaproteobacteria bacterium]